MNACEDYFGQDSNEYQLLQKGIVVHHGNMPGLFSRLLVELIQKRVVHIALATSTLSEGVNLPFETVIIPTLLRNGEPLPVSEFKNLVGRAGRPGWGTEGRTLIFLESRPLDYSSQSARKNYQLIINKLTKAQLPQENTQVISPLGALMSYIVEEWIQVSKSRSISDFMDWIEKTAPLEDTPEKKGGVAEEALDSLDGYLLSILVEQEMLTGQEMNRSDLEQYLIDVWRKTYAHYVMRRGEFWEKVFTTRGQTLQTKIYPNAEIRRRLYRTSVAPRYGKRILNNYSEIREHLKTGINYPTWSVEDRLQFIFTTVELISNLGKFMIPKSFGRGKKPPVRDEILIWWLNPSGAPNRPTKNQVSEWIKIIKTQFEYKFNWGLGTVLALILDDINDGDLQETSIDEWSKTGLPWIVFWLKELINWGTLDPVAALLLAHGVESTRNAAEIKARDYYTTCKEVPIDDILHPTRIKKWSDQFVEKRDSEFYHFKEIKVKLSRDFTRVKISKFRVVPISLDGTISWIDPAGYELATSEVPDNWSVNMESYYDFTLDAKSRKVRFTRFL